MRVKDALINIKFPNRLFLDIKSREYNQLILWAYYSLLYNNIFYPSKPMRCMLFVMKCDNRTEV